MCTGMEIAGLAMAAGSMFAQNKAASKAADAAKKAAQEQTKAAQKAAEQQRQQQAQEAKAAQLTREQEMARQKQEQAMLEEIAANQQQAPEEVDVAIEGDSTEGKKRTRQSFYSTDSAAGAGLNI